MALKLLCRLAVRSLGGCATAAAPTTTTTTTSVAAAAGGVQQFAASNAAAAAADAAAPSLQLLCAAAWPAPWHSGSQLRGTQQLSGSSSVRESITGLPTTLTGSTGGGGGAPLHLQQQPAASYGAVAQRAAVMQHSDVETYRVDVITGNVRGAGTGSAAWLQLVGSHGQSSKVVIGNSHEDGLARGSRVSFTVAAPSGIGPLRRVLVEREPSSCSDTGEGWYLEAVAVHGPRGEAYTFPCNSWFGHSDCGDFEGALERNLVPLVETEAPSPGIKPKPVEVSVSGVAFPHPEKVMKNKIRGVNMKGFGYGGEDAYFYASSQSVFGMGVADGVYMWKELGIDSGTMARTLMETCQHMVTAGCEDVYKILATAARHVESEGVQGSCTACVLTVNKDTGRLQAATLGDSGFFVVGPRAPMHGDLTLIVKFRTPQLEHEFGCPYQLGHHRYANSPADADLAALPVAAGDVVVMGSDGLLDNMSEAEVVAEVSKLLAAGAKPGAMAQRIAKVAFDNSLDKHRTTPYSRAATEAFNMVYAGGKPDDITVLVAVVS